mmetsp:Transcript_44312/g.117269  ORF Transcript_44312/g.117269 Transcript_44312/m.117269 type:complete len:208 (-) Transcript_44312:113-736(-)
MEASTLADLRPPRRRTGRTHSGHAAAGTRGAARRRVLGQVWKEGRLAAPWLLHILALQVIISQAHTPATGCRDRSVDAAGDAASIVNGNSAASRSRRGLTGNIRCHSSVHAELLQANTCTHFIPDHGSESPSKRCPGTCCSEAPPTGGCGRAAGRRTVRGFWVALSPSQGFGSTGCQCSCHGAPRPQRTAGHFSALAVGHCSIGIPP